jgi:hypothetical protein
MKVTEIDWANAPEWADRLMECRFVKYWCSVERYTETGLNKDSDLFKIGGVTIGDLSLIKMRPKQQEDNAEWVPAFGDECLVNYTYEYGHMKVFHGLEALIIGVCNDTNGDEVFTASTTSGFVSLKANGFLPLKTDEQKAKEAFYLAVVDACIPIHSDDFNIDEIAGALRHAGFTAPEGEL